MDDRIERGSFLWTRGTGGSLAHTLGAYGEASVEAVVIVTGEPVTWLGDLDADDFMRLTDDVVEVNVDFFVHRVMPTQPRRRRR